MNTLKAYPNNPHMNYYTSEGWVYLGTLKTTVNNMGIIDLYVNHSKNWVSYVYGDWGGDYVSPSYEHLFNNCPFHFKESTFKDIHKEFVRRARIQQSIGLNYA